MNHDKRIRRVGDGWGFTVRIPATRSGTRYRRQGFPTAKAAQAALTDLQTTVERTGGLTRHGSGTVAEFLTDRWVPTLPGRIRPTTRASYERIVRLHLIPHLGAVQLTALDVEHVEAMLAKLAEAGRKPHTRRNVRGVLSAALTDARRWRLIVANPVQDVAAPPDDGQTPQRAWPVDGLIRFLDHTADDRQAPLWQLYAVTGCRRGELLGLDWHRADLDAGTLEIVWQRTTVNGRAHEGPVKSRAGGRTIAIDTDTAAMLRAWRKTQAEELLRLGVRSARMFTNQSGRPWDPDEITAQFRRICDGLGLDPIGVHGLRHTAATDWLRNGQHVRAVSARLGHSHTSTTLGNYSHVMPGDDRRIADGFAARLKPNRRAK